MGFGELNIDGVVCNEVLGCNTLAPQCTSLNSVHNSLGDQFQINFGTPVYWLITFVNAIASLTVISAFLSLTFSALNGLISVAMAIADVFQRKKKVD